MKKIEKYYRESKSFSDYTERYIDYLYTLLKSVDRKELTGFMEVLLSARDGGATIFFLGNGGSASTASHYVNDLCKFANSDKAKKIKAVSLSDNISWFTALANDEGYENIFCRQLENFIQKGDVVVGISASGNSENIVRALELANNNGAISVAITGFDGGKIKRIAAHCVHVKSEKGEYGPVEDIHLILCHLISSYIAFSSLK